MHIRSLTLIATVAAVVNIAQAQGPLSPSLDRSSGNAPSSSSTRAGNAAQSPRADPASGGLESPDSTRARESSGDRGTMAECRPSSVNCPVGDSSGSSVISTDSQPIGSTGDRDKTISESGYPTSVGSGSLGSGATGAPTGPDPGPTIGIGR